LHAVAPHLGKFVVKSERCIAAHWKWRRHARVEAASAGSFFRKLADDLGAGVPDPDRD
jgi:hypothetical protein